MTTKIKIRVAGAGGDNAEKVAIAARTKSTVATAAKERRSLRQPGSIAATERTTTGAIEVEAEHRKLDLRRQLQKLLEPAFAIRRRRSSITLP